MDPIPADNRGAPSAASGYASSMPCISKRYFVDTQSGLMDKVRELSARRPRRARSRSRHDVVDLLARCDRFVQGSTVATILGGGKTKISLEGRAGRPRRNAFKRTVCGNLRMECFLHGGNRRVARNDSRHSA